MTEVTTTTIKGTETTCTGFTMRATMTMMTWRRGGAQYNFFLLFSTFCTCFIWFVFVNQFSGCELSFEPNTVKLQTRK